jgi:hypothetical protein
MPLPLASDAWIASSIPRNFRTGEVVEPYSSIKK